MAGGKRALEGKKERSRKRTAIDLELKLRMIKKYEDGRTISAIAREFCLAKSTVNTIVKDASRIKEHAKGTACTNSTIITKRREGAITEMEKLLTTWMADRIQNGLPLGLTTVRAKARSLFDDLKVKYPQGTQSFGASNGWFARFKNRAGFRNFGTFGEAERPEPEPEPDERREEESSDAGSERSSNAYLFRLEEEKNKVPEPEAAPKRFSTKEMAAAFRELSSGLARFEKMDPDASRFLKVRRTAEDAFACYREIYEDRVKDAVHESLHRFVRKVERPGSSRETDVRASTSRHVAVSTSSHIDEALLSIASPSASSSSSSSSTD